MQARFKFRLYDKAIGEMVYDICIGFIKDSGKTNDEIVFEIQEFEKEFGD